MLPRPNLSTCPDLRREKFIASLELVLGGKIEIGPQGDVHWDHLNSKNCAVSEIIGYEVIFRDGWINAATVETFCEHANIDAYRVYHEAKGVLVPIAPPKSETKPQETEQSGSAHAPPTGDSPEQAS